jgi:hypothetical protein
MNVRDILPRDAIPSIDDPAFGPSSVGDPEDQVVVLDADPPRAFPIRILSYHEVVNDVVDDTPVAVTWCPICGSAVVYDRRVDSRTLEFGVSGKLADDDLVMYDRETESEWKQSLGTCIAGELEGAELRVLPAAMTTCERFERDHPDGVVLQPAAGRDPDSYEMEPYERYFDAEGFGAEVMRGTGLGRSWDRDDIGPKEEVLGIGHGGEAVGYPRSRVEAAGGAVTDTVGSLDVVVFATEDSLHAFEDPGHEFERADGGFDADGTSWDPTTGEGEDGRRLERVPAKRLFAFAWQDDHGPDAFWSV